MKTVKCFYQVFRPPPEIGSRKIEGFGDCTTCQPNPEENKKCRGYQPTTIELKTFFVEKKKVLEQKEIPEVQEILEAKVL